MMIWTHLRRAAALTIGGVVYFARAWCCSHVLGTFSPQDDVPYAHFDYHGLGAMTGWLLALLFSPIAFWIAQRAILRSETETGPHAPLLQRQTKFRSLVVAMAIGAPTFTQTAYCLGLPPTVTMPIIVSMLIWAGLIAASWIMFIRRRDVQRIAEEIRWRALLLAALITAPKVLLIGSALLWAP